MQFSLFFSRSNLFKDWNLNLESFSEKQSNEGGFLESRCIDLERMEFFARDSK